MGINNAGAEFVNCSRIAIETKLPSKVFSSMVFREVLLHTFDQDLFERVRPTLIGIPDLSAVHSPRT